jgi:hypothetical protein
MNIKAIIASLVLGSSSVALAAPSVTFKPTATDKLGATTQRDHRVEGTRERVYRPIYRPAPVVVKPAPIVIQPAPVAVYRPQPYRTGWFSAGWHGGWNRPSYQPVYQPVTLASDLSFYGEDRKFITVGSQAGLFSKLELNGAAGRTFIKQVYVQFADGQEQVIRDLDRTLSNGECLTLDLDGNRRAIKRIVVYGSEINNGWHRQQGAFSVTAA